MDPGSPFRRSSSSYVHGVSETPLRGITVSALLSETSSAFPDSDAVVAPHQGIRWSYGDLNRRVDLAAAGLLSIGLQPGDRIGLLAPNITEWVVLQFATARAGLILVNINPAYRIPELEFALNQVGVKALVTVHGHKSSNYHEILLELMPELATDAPGTISSAVVPSLKWLIGIGDTGYPDSTINAISTLDEIIERADSSSIKRIKQIESSLQFDDPINIQFTSGTTGRPKASTLTHHNIVNNAYFSGLQMQLGHEDRMCIPVPMYHCFGMVLGTLSCIAHGATMVFPSSGFDPEACLDAIENERCTVFHGVPTMFIAVLESPDFAKRDLRTLRTGIMAGAPCPAELMRRVITEMNMREITIAYGMTETGPVSTQTSVSDPIEKRVETVGRILPHTEIKIVDRDGKVLPVGEAGELLTRGYCVMPKYWNDPEKTANAIDEARWIASGDLATMDAEGYFRIVGRIKDMLIRGGENIFPREIEDFLYTHPAIEEVEVIGVPDEKYGEEVCAWVKVRAGHSVREEGIREFCKGKIAHFKIPKYIRFVDSFPMTITGKVQKYKMREIMANEMAGKPMEPS